MLLTALMIISLALTCTMFATRERMLGFACGIFWVMTGAQSYTLSTVTWDMYYFLFFASAFGMTVFTILAQYGLREKRDSLADEGLEKGEGGYIDEEKGEKEPDILSEELETKPSKRTQRLRKRADDRRTKF